MGLSGSGFSLLKILTLLVFLYFWRNLFRFRLWNRHKMCIFSMLTSCIWRIWCISSTIFMTNSFYWINGGNIKGMFIYKVVWSFQHGCTASNILYCSGHYRPTQLWMIHINIIEQIPFIFYFVNMVLKKDSNEIIPLTVKENSPVNFLLFFPLFSQLNHHYLQRSSQKEHRFEC